MPVTYHKSHMEVLVGDHIEFKSWIAFWRGWISGRVHYVPGRSPKNPEMEFNGLTWIGIGFGKGEQQGVLVVPETQQVRHTVRFVRRSDDGLVETPKNYEFGD